MELELFVWSVQGELGLQNDAYVGFFGDKMEAVAYRNENLGPQQWTLFKVTEAPPGSPNQLEFTEASVRTAS